MINRSGDYSDITKDTRHVTYIMGLYWNTTQEASSL